MRSLERQLISAELKQRSEEGCDVKDISKRVEIALTEKVSDAEIFALTRLISLPVDRASPTSNLRSRRDQTTASDARRLAKKTRNFSIEFMVGWVVRIAPWQAAGLERSY